MSEETTTEKPRAVSVAGAITATPAVVAPSGATTTVPVTEPAAPREVKIKVRKPKQRACDERNAKGKLCGGHLKRWYDYPREVATMIGKDAEIYRCEFCKTLYKP